MELGEPLDDDEDQQSESDSVPMVTRPQLDKIHAQLNDLTITQRTDKLTTVGLLVQRELASSSDLTRPEADQVIDTLSHVLNNEEPVRALDAILAGLELKAD